MENSVTSFIKVYDILVYRMLESLKKYQIWINHFPHLTKIMIVKIMKLPWIKEFSLEFSMFTRVAEWAWQYAKASHQDAFIANTW